MQLTLVRHGEAAPPVNGVDSKRPLTQRGHLQAQQTANFLKEIVQPDVFVVSTLLRAQETLAHIQTYFPNISVLVCDKIKPDDDAKLAIEWLSQLPFERIVVVCHMNVVAHIAEQLTHDIDVVIPIPDTSRTSALELANMLGVKFREGFMKNRYIGRTFIMPGQQQRTKSVRQKLNPVELEFKGKNVLLVDDSIVRGTTCNEIIQMARDAGAKKVYFASAAPMVKYPNVYGIDMPAKAELIASHRSVEEIQEIIGADRLIFQDLDDLKAAVRTSKVPVIQDFDCSVFDGVYVTGDIDEQYLTDLEQSRSDTAKKEKDGYIDVNIDAASVDLSGIKEEM